MLKSKTNNRVVAGAGYTVSGVYAVGSVVNAVQGSPLGSILCGGISALTAALTNDATHEHRVMPTDV